VKVTNYVEAINTQHGGQCITRHVRDLVDTCHGVASECGWWSDPVTGEKVERNTGELLMLCVSELAEAMEADRKDLNDDHLPDRKGLEVELADCLIRIFDMAGGLNLDVAGAMAEKMQYNTKRADHKPEARADGGKKY